MISGMIVVALPPPRLAAVLVLTGLVLIGRAVISAHPYEHDPVELPAQCELCACCQLFEDDVLGAVATSLEARAAERALLVFRSPALAFRRGTRLPRAPPLKLL